MLKKVHIGVFLVWLLYSMGGKITFAKSAATQDFFLSYGFIAFQSALFGIFFLYLFSHEDFFRFAKKIEKKEIKEEKKLLKVFKHAGRITITFLAGLILGPLFTALTARFLLRRNRFRYLIVGIICAAAGVFWLAVAKGAIHIIL